MFIVVIDLLTESPPDPPSVDFFSKYPSNSVLQGSVFRISDFGFRVERVMLI